ncbi:MAG: hypothetical protein R3326_07035, partial [Gemmatimonadota bacterium]|nr:hypothetical protein [Gemmatimonadota bacterium]
MRRIVPFLLAFLLVPALARAQRSDERPEARAVRIEGAPPAIDGRLDDPAWDAAPVLTGLVQKIPD